MRDRFDIDQVIKITGLGIRAEQADGGADFDVACQIAVKKLWKIKEYESLEEQNKLLKLPCAVGDTVYEVQDFRKRIQPYTIIAVHVSNCGNLYGWELKDGKGVYSNVNGFSEYDLGKSVFLTREEAEAALKELERAKGE